jgi:hypothetical protein
MNRDSLNEIEYRQKRNRWRDPLFLGMVLLLAALSIGSVTSKAQGRITEHQWSVTLVDPANQLIIR